MGIVVRQTETNPGTLGLPGLGIFRTKSWEIMRLLVLQLSSFRYLSSTRTFAFGPLDKGVGLSGYEKIGLSASVELRFQMIVED